MTLSKERLDELIADASKYPADIEECSIYRELRALRAQMREARKLLEAYERDDDDEDATGDFLINRVRAFLAGAKP